MINIALNPKSVRGSDGNFLLNISATGTGYSLLACLMDTVTVNDSRSTQEHSTFCDASGDVVAGIAGGRTVSIGATLELVLAGAGLAIAETAYENNDEVYIQEVMESVDGLATETISYKGFITNFGKSIPQNGIARRSFEFRVNEIVTTP